MHTGESLWKDQWGGIFAAASGLCYRLCLAAHVGNAGCYLDDRLPALLVTEARGFDSTACSSLQLSAASCVLGPLLADVGLAAAL